MLAIPAIILTDYRTGGSFLSLCLDSHPLIFCARGEPLARRSGIFRYFSDLQSEQVLQYIFKAEFCKVAMCKIIYRQAGPKVWKYLAARKPKVVHLIRRNVFRAACSYLFQRYVLQGIAEHPHPLHHFNRKPSQPLPIWLEPHAIVDLCRERITVRRKVLQSLEKYELPVQVVYYEQMCKGKQIEVLPKQLNETLCDFLDVDHYQMTAPYMRRVNAQYPLSKLIRNWREVKLLVKETEFAHYLRGEE